MSKRPSEEDTATMEEADAGRKRSGVIPSTIADVLKDLNGLEFPGAPSVGGKAAAVPTAPGLTVKGMGLVPLPIVSEDTVKQLAAVATKAPFGKGPDTLIDETVRKSWQIEPAQVSFGNPSFSKSIETLAESAARGLGVPEEVPVEVILYKVLLYEPGGFFKKHRDTEKEDGMFATLVVQLPSIYSGGDLKVSHGEDDSKVYAMGTDDGTAPYCCSFVAHYADCEHQVEVVASGYRLALVYSLCRKGKDAEVQIPTMEMAIGPAKKLLSTLERLPAPKHAMFLPLHHCYTTVSLTRYGLQALKGWDSAILRAFQLDGTWKFRIFEMCRTYREEAEEDFLDDFDGSEEEHLQIHTSEAKEGVSKPSFKEIYWTEGTVSRVTDKWLSSHGDRLYISCEDGGHVLASPNVIAEAWKVASQIETEYTGNEGYRERETQYQCYTLMVYRADAELDLVMEYNISEAIEMVTKAAGKEPKEPTYVDRLFHVLRSLPPRVPEEKYSSDDKCDDAGKALALLGEPKDGDFLEDAWVRNLTACVNLVVFMKVFSIGKFWTELGKIVAKCSMAKNAQVLVSHFQPLLEKPIENVREATIKAYLVALVSVSMPNVSIDAMVEALAAAVDPDKIQMTTEYRVPPVLESMMELDITPSIHPLVRKLFPLWKAQQDRRNYYGLFSIIGDKMDANTRNQFVDEIIPPVVDGRFLQYNASSLRKGQGLFHMVFERGTDEHVKKLSTIVNEDRDEAAAEVRWLLPMFWKDYTGSTQSQEWEPLMERLMNVSTKETVDRILAPTRLLVSFQSNLANQTSDLVHFLFANGSDEDVIKLLELVDSKVARADEVREGLFKLYKCYEGDIKAKHAWGVVIQRLEKMIMA